MRQRQSPIWTQATETGPEVVLLIEGGLNEDANAARDGKIRAIILAY